MRGFRLGLAALVALGLAVPARAQDAPPKWGASLDVEGKVGTKRHLGEADLFVPLLQDHRTLLFADARFRIDDDSVKEGNLGLGLRHMLGEWNLGGYGYFDRRRSAHAHWFNQLTFGAEALGRDFDVRANGYVPIGTTAKPVDALNAAELSGTTVIFRGGEERAIGGFDAEVGWRVPVFDFDGPYDLRLYAGGYRFDDDEVPDVTGPRLRAEFTAYELPELWSGTRLTLGAEWQTDSVRGGQAFFSARLRIPLQSEAQRNRALTAQERRMTTPIVRDVDIVAQAGAFGAPETATQTASGSAITVVSSAATTGANLPAAVTAAGANSTVILSGTFNTVAATTLQAGQTLMGAGTTTVRAPSGRTATLSTPTATIAGAAVGGINQAVNLANNSTVTGLTVTNTVASFAAGIRADGVSGATVANSTITAAATGNTGQAVVISGGSTNITVSGNTIRATSTPGSVAMGVNISSSTATVTGNTISATNNASTNTIGIALSNADNATVSGNTIASTGDGLQVNTGSTGVTVSGNTFGTIGVGVIRTGTTAGFPDSFTAASTGNSVTGAVGGQRCTEGAGGASGTITFTDGNDCNF